MSKDKIILVVNASKMIEQFASAALSSLLDIDLESSKTLSNKSSAFSFKQKLDLLTDINAFDKRELPKFEKFTEIRNQFAHNFKVQDFETCFSFINGAEKYLRKQFPKITDKEKSHEAFLLELFMDLFFNIISIVGEIIKAIESKIEKEVGERVKREHYETLIMDIKAYAEANPEFGEFYNRSVDKLLDKKEPE
jgi:hypothetical protein